LPLTCHCVIEILQTKKMANKNKFLQRRRLLATYTPRRHRSIAAPRPTPTRSAKAKNKVAKVSALARFTIHYYTLSLHGILLRIRAWSTSSNTNIGTNTKHTAKTTGHNARQPTAIPVSTAGVSATEPPGEEEAAEKGEEEEEEVEEERKVPSPPNTLLSLSNPGCRHRRRREGHNRRACMRACVRACVLYVSVRAAMRGP
jgi:hypothetical protein